MARTSKRARSAESGKFVPMDYANANPSTTIIEEVKVGPIKHRK